MFVTFLVFTLFMSPVLFTGVVFFKKNAAFCIFRHLLHSIRLASNLRCPNYELLFDQKKNLKISLILVERNPRYD